MNWNISSFTLLDRGQLKARFNLETSWGYINGFKIVQIPGREPFVSLPGNIKKDEFGGTEYVNRYVAFKKDGTGALRWEKIQKLALRRYNKEISKSNDHEVVTEDEGFDYDDNEFTNSL